MPASTPPISASRGPHVAVGHHRVQQRERGAGEDERQHARAPRRPRCRAAASRTRRRPRTRSSTGCTPISTGPSVITAQYISTCCSIGRAPLHAEQAVERGVDGGHQHHRGDEEEHQADRGQAPGVAGERLIWSAMVSMPCASGRKFSSRNSCSAPIASSNTGNARRHRERHRDQRHQRQQRGVGQAARGLQRRAPRRSARTPRGRNRRTLARRSSPFLL